MTTLPERGHHLRSLVRAAADLSGADTAAVVAARAAVLGPRSGERGVIRSTLNNDGTPLQVCVTAHARGRAVRLIGDPGASAPTIRARVAAGRAASIALFGSTPSGVLAARTVTALLPASITDRVEALRGVLWLASGVRGTERAVYVKARWDGACADWERVRTCVQALLPAPEEAEDAIDALRGCAQPVSVGYETAGDDRARLKIYWRLERPVVLASLGIALLREDAFRDVLERVVGRHSILSSGLVFSTSYALRDGTSADAKVDVCAHCLPYAPAQWNATAERLAADHGLESPGIEAALRDGWAEPAFLGFGVDRQRRARLNVYLKE
ncbi:MAG TPA: hypothetical protein VMD91_02475 [Candidatus Sulfotelmatobacter sp.]|nr:hypothetical protein [Candidatus Sulfotelmatobacter sp.]